MKTFQVIVRMGTTKNFQWDAVTCKEGLTLEGAVQMAACYPKNLTRIPATGSDIMKNITTLNAKGQISR